MPGTADDIGGTGRVSGAGARASETVVVVTGASGFVGSHTVKLLLSRGYRVRATVRDAGNEERTAFLRALAAETGRYDGGGGGSEKPRDNGKDDAAAAADGGGGGGVAASADAQLKLYSADLGDAASWQAPFQGAHYAVHCAAAVMLTARDPQREIVDVTVNGLRHVLDACKAGALRGDFRKLVLCSSQAAVLDLALPDDHVLTETDWNESETLRSDPYSYSKVVAERMAWEYVRNLKPSESFALACVNPGAIYGPILTPSHARSSPVFFEMLLKGKMSMGAPRFSFAACDVRDVALAQALALESEAATGRFLVLTDRSKSMLELAQATASALPAYSKKMPSRHVPNFAMWLAPLFDKRLSFRFVRAHLGRTHVYDTSRAQSVLGIKFRDLETETVPDTCASLIEHGIVPDLRVGEGERGEGEGGEQVQGALEPDE